MSTWDESKRRKNIKEHGLDFAGCEAIWDNFTITREDVREAYGEKRLVTFGLLEGTVAVLVHTERRTGSHIISLRKAEKHETSYYFKIAKAYFK
ncbi:MAG: BrnT family toxin [Burkholderiales bacterium]